MKLSELKTGEKGVIVKVLGHGGFRKRIVEMGFIKGKIVEVLLNAPLQDPVKYKIMGYEVSLRHNEADMIEIISVEEAMLLESNNTRVQSTEKVTGDDACDFSLTDKQLKAAAMKKRRTINVALVGNPNCGKTSLFNFASGAHERVGNYSGVTVDAKEGHATFEGYEFNIVDLPGTYSLSAYSPEELYVRKQIIEKTPDIVINVIDSSNIERNLYLTTQLVDMHLRMICALNMYDEFENRGDKLDYKILSQLFGVPMIPTVFKTGKGVEMLFHIIINMYEGVDFLDKNGNINPEVAADIRDWHKAYGNEHSQEEEHGEDFAHGDRPNNSVYRHIHLNHGPQIEESIEALKSELQEDEHIRHKYSTRYLSIKLLEMDSETERLVNSLPNGKRIIDIRDKQADRIKKENAEDCETAIMDAKYGFIHGALQEAGYEKGNKQDTYQITHAIDSVITNKYIGFPLFFLLIYVMFQATFSLGQYPMDWIENGVTALSDLLSSTLADGPLKDMLVDGIIGGVGAVIVFLPQILILYGFISFMEDSGYMARAAFIMDKLMHKMGLHGKSFIPLIMGFGCNVPAIMSTRTIESRRSRLITMLILPLMSCSARLPIYIMITGTFFAVRYQSLIMISLYAIGILLSVIMSRIFSRWIIRGEDLPFVMELPPYRFPTSKAIMRHTWEKGKQYLKKMGGIILVASIIVWALGYFPHNNSLNAQQQQEQSYIGRIGKTIEPIFHAQGFDWRLDVGLIAGVGAKEIVASTLGVLYSGDDTVTDNDQENRESNDKYSNLYLKMSANGITPLIAFCYLLFVLIYFPCLATIAAIKHESGSWRWAIFAAIYTTVLAWFVSAAVYQIGMLMA
ncbi:ferrous iron transport protein B [Xylanibacter rodentium]|uniref:Ferrous iron transport protein B n=4 Tax=Xylanibacter rodentium TaxID=2736289 RepID=A0ABX2AW29_9BACT|nr:ferrous iron transport protein B [Xylanibacter rodentium]NPE10999.1 ferrous iron transport protein B [Prevotella sp. PJ1A]NPE14153.1 ferrous iron transport protein B [Xylanibacter rodentium]NPE37459.1 ferrous iron transport protein B [Prevotella sp. PCJ2]